MGGPFDGHGRSAPQNVMSDAAPLSLKERLDNLQKEYERLISLRRHTLMTIAGLCRHLGTVVEDRPAGMPETHQLIVPGDVMETISGDEVVYMNLGDANVLTVNVREKTPEEAEETKKPESRIVIPTMVPPVTLQ